MMKFDIFSKSIPAMPATGEGTEVINFILQNASEDMRQPLASMMFPALATHVNTLDYLTIYNLTICTPVTAA